MPGVAGYDWVHRLACPRSGRAYHRHRDLVTAWRQVFTEAGGQVPRRNVERLLRDTLVRVPADDQRRLDIIAPNLNVASGPVLVLELGLAAMTIKLAPIKLAPLNKLATLKVGKLEPRFAEQ